MHIDPRIRILRSQPLSIPLGVNRGPVRWPAGRKEGTDGFLHSLQTLGLEHTVQDGKVGGAEGEAGFHYHDVYSRYGVYWENCLS